jgi:hypothetical protein
MILHLGFPSRGRVPAGRQAGRLALTVIRRAVGQHPDLLSLVPQILAVDLSTMVEAVITVARQFASVRRTLDVHSADAFLAAREAQECFNELASANPEAFID